MSPQVLAQRTQLTVALTTCFTPAHSNSDTNDKYNTSRQTYGSLMCERLRVWLLAQVHGLLVDVETLLLTEVLAADAAVVVTLLLVSRVLVALHVGASGEAFFAKATRVRQMLAVGEHVH